MLLGLGIRTSFTLLVGDRYHERCSSFRLAPRGVGGAIGYPGSVLTYEIDTGRRLVRARASGKLTAAEVVAFQAALRASADFDPGFALLADYRDVVTSDFTADGMRVIAGNVPFHPASRRAFVVREGLNEILGRLFVIISSAAEQGGTVRLFTDLDAALRWLAGELPAETR